MRTELQQLDGSIPLKQFKRQMIEVKQSVYRPGQVLRVPGGLGSQIS
jgi:hypothetical protein